MNKEFQESRDKLANILLFKIDSLKKENEELGMLFSLDGHN